MKISCIIPTCDRFDFLLETIDSVLRQTLLPDEIIIVNNGRNSVRLPDELIDKAAIYNIIPYAGVAQARNFGACMANGDYLAFLDDDDMWSTNYLENVSKAVQEGAVCVLSRMDSLVDGRVVPWKNPHCKITIPNLLIANPGAGGPNIVIAKKIFFEIGGYDPKLPPSEDKGLVLELLKAGMEVKTLPDNQVIARVHKGKRLTDSDRIVEGICQFVRKYRHLMNMEQYFTNQVKIYKHKYDSGKKTAVISYVFLRVLTKLLGIIKK